MAIETIDREIHGKTYKITKHGAKEGRKILARLMARLGKPLASVGSPGGGMASGLAELVVGFTPAEVDYFCDVFAPKTMVDNARLSDVFDDHFAGDYDAMLEWLITCVEVNFETFFVGLRAKIGAALKKAKEAMEAMEASGFGSRKGATGRSTVSPSPSATPQV
jgi:hypothetical protein